MLISGWEGDVTVFYGTSKDRILAQGISGWKLTLQKEVTGVLLARDPEGPEPRNRLYLRTPFVSASVGVLEFSMFYDDEEHPFDSPVEWWAAGRWVASLLLRGEDIAEVLDLVDDYPGNKRPKVECNGTLQGLALASHVRSVPEFQVTLALDVIDFGL